MGWFTRSRQGPTRQQIAQARREICYSCPGGQLRFIAGQPNCRGCGCFIDAKSFLINQKCPYGYWAAYGV